MYSVFTDLIFIKFISLDKDKRSLLRNPVLQYTGAREQNIMKVRVRKKVSILVKAPEAPLLKYVN